MTIPYTGIFIAASCNLRSSHGQYTRSSTEHLQYGAVTSARLPGQNYRNRNQNKVRDYVFYKHSSFNPTWLPFDRSALIYVQTTRACSCTSGYRVCQSTYASAYGPRVRQSKGLPALLSLALALIPVWIVVDLIIVIEPVVGGNCVAPGIDINGSCEGVPAMDVIGLAVARLVEVDMRNCFNPAPPVCLTTEGVRAQRHESRGRAGTLFDQVIWRFLRRFGATVTDKNTLKSHTS
jgi:hypothetical protein